MLLHHSAIAYSALGDAVWKRWADAVLYGILLQPRLTEQDQEELLARTISVAPMEMRNALLHVLQNPTDITSIWRLSSAIVTAWCPELESRILDLVRSQPTSSRIYAEALDVLANRNPILAVEVVGDRLQQGTIEADRESASVALSFCVGRALAEAWPLVRRLMETDPELVAEALLKSHVRTYSPHRGLEAAQLGELYLWLEEHFPTADDPRGDGWVSPRQQIGEWRDQLLETLVSMGTTESLAVLKKVATSQQDALPWLRRTVARAEEVMRDESWPRVSPGELVALAADA